MLEGDGSEWNDLPAPAEPVLGASADSDQQDCDHDSMNHFTPSRR